MGAEEASGDENAPESGTEPAAAEASGSESSENGTPEAESSENVSPENESSEDGSSESGSGAEEDYDDEWGLGSRSKQKPCGEFGIFLARHVCLGSDYSQTLTPQEVNKVCQLF